MLQSLEHDAEASSTEIALNHGLEADPDGTELEQESADFINEPFDPTQIRVGVWAPTIDLITTRIREDEIDLVPEFQRHGNIWTDTVQSRLIESILIRIPLPAFYMDATNEDRLVVIDGNQRLTALKRFVIDKTLRLVGLDYLDLDGRTYEELSRKLRRRIEETQLTVYLIEKGTPESVKYNIFKRINTGGLPLSPQEIRHALNPGPIVKLLRELAESKEFDLATDGAVSMKRMADRECVLRFIAFATRPYTEYRSKDLDGFLHQTMGEVNQMTEVERSNISHRFRRAMRAAHEILDKYAFRKSYRHSASRGPINKALFETWSVNLDERTDPEHALLVQRKDKVQDGFIELLSNDRAFEASVSVGTGEPGKVSTRFRRIHDLLDQVLE
jgi:hypothetical protein